MTPHGDGYRPQSTDETLPPISDENAAGPDDLSRWRKPRPPSPLAITVYGDPPYVIKVDGRFFRLVETTPGPNADRQWQRGEEFL